MQVLLREMVGFVTLINVEILMNLPTPATKPLSEFSRMTYETSLGVIEGLMARI